MDKRETILFLFYLMLILIYFRTCIRENTLINFKAFKINILKMLLQYITH